ncbi:hypothetical protein GY45DRAFT_113045 [Cubamyces sp. BRFM 1775]|nr:hypothetical protein GY45DRAFT_113045 [Cubamyces sp. BRFM 1775]
MLIGITTWPVTGTNASEKVVNKAGRVRLAPRGVCRMQSTREDEGSYRSGAKRGRERGHRCRTRLRYQTIFGFAVVRSPALFNFERKRLPARRLGARGKPQASRAHDRPTTQVMTQQRRTSEPSTNHSAAARWRWRRWVDPLEMEHLQSRGDQLGRVANEVRRRRCCDQPRKSSRPPHKLGLLRLGTGSLAEYESGTRHMRQPGAPAS